MGRFDYIVKLLFKIYNVTLFLLEENVYEPAWEPVKDGPGRTRRKHFVFANILKNEIEANLSYVFDIVSLSWKQILIVTALV
jgi:hypothetical protein